MRMTLSEKNDMLSAEISALKESLAYEKNLSADRLRVAEQVPALREQVSKMEALEKSLKEAQTMRDHYMKAASTAEGEIEQCHAVLDAVDGAPSRTYEKDYGEGKRNTVTRLAGAFLSISRGAK